MLNLQIGKRESEILNDLVDVQLEALYSLLDKGYDQECLEILSQYQFDEKDLQNEIKVKISQYKDLYGEPLMLGILSDGDLSILRHLLFHMEDKYSKRDHLPIHNLWETFFKIEEYRSPKIQYSLSKITKKHGNKQTNKVQHPKCRGNRP